MPGVMLDDTLQNDIHICAHHAETLLGDSSLAEQLTAVQGLLKCHVESSYDLTGIAPELVCLAQKLLELKPPLNDLDKCTLNSLLTMVLILIGMSDTDDGAFFLKTLILSSRCSRIVANALESLGWSKNHCVPKDLFPYLCRWMQEPILLSALFSVETLSRKAKRSRKTIVAVEELADHDSDMVRSFVANTLRTIHPTSTKLSIFLEDSSPGVRESALNWKRLNSLRRLRNL